MKLSTILRICFTRSLQPFALNGIYKNFLDFEQLEQLGLSIHIPFCKKAYDVKPPYDQVLYDLEAAKKYMQALSKEIDLVGQRLLQKKKITKLYLSGETSVLMIDDIKKIIAKIQEYFIIEDGIGIELSPDDITEQNLAKLKTIGITMIQIRIPSFQENNLVALGKTTPDYSKMQIALQKVPFEIVNIDLTFNIPGQTVNSLKQDIETAFTFGATQVSIYPLSNFTFSDNVHKPFSKKDLKKLLKEISAYCKQNNYHRTSVFSFSKPEIKKYFPNTCENFLGFGVASPTLLKEQFKINTFSLEGYFKRIEQSYLPTALTLDFTLKQRATYYLFQSAYNMKIDKQAFEKYFHFSLHSLLGIEIIIARLFGLLKKEEYGYSLTEKAVYYFHLIAQEHINLTIDKICKTCTTKPFPEKIVL